MLVTRQLRSLQLSEQHSTANNPSLEDCLSIWADCYENSPHLPSSSLYLEDNPTPSLRKQGHTSSPPPIHTSSTSTSSLPAEEMKPLSMTRATVGQEGGGGVTAGSIVTWASSQRSSKNQKRTDRSSVVLFVLECNSHALSSPDFIKVRQRSGRKGMRSCLA